MKFVKFGNPAWLAINMDEIASIREITGGVTIEMRNGTRHDVLRLTVAEVVERCEVPATF